MKVQLLVGLLASASMAASCGRQESEETPAQQEPSELDRLNEQLFNLQGTVSQINALVLSDWSSCVQGGADNITAFQRNICRIAQAATAEQALKWRGVLSDFASQTERELQDLQTLVDALPSGSDVNQIKSDLYGTGSSCATATAGSLCVRLNTAEANITSLQSSVATHTGQINTLISDVATINSQIAAVINGAMLEITIGQENLAAGPLFESVLRNPGRSRITAYIESVDPNVSVANNGCSATNGSPTLTVTTSAAHGLTAGNVVKLGGFTACRGWTSAQLNDQYVVVTAPTTTTFTVTLSTNATSGGTGGGSNAYVQNIKGRGLGRAWQTSDNEVLLSTTGNNKPYSFLVTGAATVFAASPGGTVPFTWVNGSTPVGSGWVCYDISNRSATAVQIKTGGSSVRCY